MIPGQFLRVTRGLLRRTLKSTRRYSSAVPTTKSESTRTESDNSFLNVNLINHLERTSLVDFGNEEALVRLKEAVKFADILFKVDTSGVKPLDSVLELESVYLRPDKVGTTNRQEILRNAPITEEDYIVAPPGNIPLEQRKS